MGRDTDKMLIVWKDELYATGHERIDDQHKEMFRQVNALMAATRRGVAKSELLEMLAFLEDYSIDHFTAEEALTMRHHCEFCRKNRRAHVKFREMLRRCQAQMQVAGPSEGMAPDLRRYLADWLVAHISRVDQSTMRHCRS